MKVTSDLLAKNIIIVGSIILLIELIISLIYYGLFVIQINRETPLIRNQSFIHIEEILNSFNQIIIQKYINAITDLYLIQQHSTLFTDSLISASPYLDNITNESIEYLIPENNNSYKEDYLSMIKTTILNMNQEAQINTLLSNQFLKTMVFYSNNNNVNYNDKLFRAFHYHLIEIMKTIAIRDIITVNNNKQFVLLNENVISAYPPMPLSFQDLKKMDFYSHDVSSCRETIYEQKCFSELLTNEANVLTIVHPINKAKGLKTQLCIYLKAPFNANSLLAKNATLCSDLVIESSLGDSFSHESNEIFIVQYNKDLDDIQVLYTMNNEIHFNNSFLQSDLQKTFKYKNDGLYSLFHIIYYKLMQYSELSQVLINHLEKEYIEGTRELKEFLKRNTEVNIIKRFISNFTFYNRQYDSVGNLTYDSGYSLNDIFIMVVSPIAPHISLWDKIQKKNNNNQKDSIIFYSIVICNNNERAFYKEHTHLFLYKELKLGAYYLCLIIVGKYVVFNLTSDFVNYILKPINKYHKSLKKAFERSIAKNNEYNNQTNEIKSKEANQQDNNLKNNVSIMNKQKTIREKGQMQFSSNHNMNIINKKNETNDIIAQTNIQSHTDFWNSNNEETIKYPVYTNVDTQELESYILYIQNIYYTKSSNSIENLQNKISIFEHLSNVILNKDSPIIKLDCLYLISFVQYKLKLYNNSLSTLSQLMYLINKLKHDESSNESLFNYFIKITQT